MKINKYKEFINENNEERIDFRDAIENTVSKMTARDGYNHVPSYSVLCRRKDGDPDKQFEEIQYNLNGLGWTLDEINKLGDQELSNVAHQLDSHNGYYDIYLYKLFETLKKSIRVELGGSGYSVDITNNMDYGDGESEILIRYRYGHHKTKYGQLILKQNNISIEEFKSLALKEVINSLKDTFKDKVSNLIYTLMKWPYETRVLVAVSKLKKPDDYILLDYDRVIIFSKKILDELINNEFEYGNFDREKFKELITVDVINDEFISYFEDYYITDVIKTDRELIVYGDFE